MSTLIRYRQKWIIAFALCLVATILALRLELTGAGDAVGLLLMVPVALVAAESGWRKGVAAGVAGGALNIGSVLMVGAPLTT